MDVIYLLGSIGLGWGSSFVHPSAWAVNVNSSAPADKGAWSAQTGNEEYTYNATYSEIDGTATSEIATSSNALMLILQHRQVMLTYKVFFCLYPMFRLMWLLLFLQILCHYH